jgi:hypothetical protein
MDIRREEDILFCPTDWGKSRYFSDQGHICKCRACGFWFRGSLGAQVAHTPDGRIVYGGCAVGDGNGLVGSEIEGLRARNHSHASAKFTDRHEAQMAHITFIQATMRKRSDDELVRLGPPVDAPYSERTEEQLYAQGEIHRRQKLRRIAA